MTLFWILSKIRYIIGSRVDPRLGMDRLDVLVQLSRNISEILKIDVFRLFGSVLCYFGQYDFQKSIFSPCGMSGYEHDLGRKKTNLDVFYPILNLFFALQVQNHPNSKSDTALRFQYPERSVSKFRLG